MLNMNWDTIGYITSSKIRFRVLTYLNKKKATPTKISKDLDLNITSVSRCLRELLNKELIISLTKTLKKDKYYDISDKGKEILNDINKETLL